MVLIAVQLVLTAVLAILIAVNAIIVCIRENPHRKQRKEPKKLHRDLDNLTPLDPRNSLLMDPTDYKDVGTARVASYPLRSCDSKHDSRASSIYRNETAPPEKSERGRESVKKLVDGAASMGHEHSRSSSCE